MYLTAVDLRWEETVPAQTPTRKKLGGERLCHDLPAAVRAAGTPPGPGACAARVWGQIWPASGNTDKPSPGSKPLPRVTWTRGRATGTGARTLAPLRSLGSLRTRLCFGEPLHVLHGHPAPGAPPEGLRSPGSLYRLSPASAMPTRPPPGVLAKRRGRRWKRSSPGEARRLWEGPLARPLPRSRPGCEARGPRGPQTVETTSSVPQETGLCVCEWLTFLCPPTQPTLPAAQRDRAGSTCPPWRQRKEKVFYIRYLFNISF